MKRLLLAFAVLLLGFSAMAYSQAKVGTAGTGFLAFSPSPRANGMGEAGVAIVDLNSPYFNPALIAPPAKPYRFSTSFWPVKNNFVSNVIKFGSCNALFSFPVGIFGLNENHRVSIGYFRTSIEAGPIPYTTYEYPDGTGEYFMAHDFMHNLVFAHGLRTFLDISAGISLKLIGESYDAESWSTHAIDYGLLFGRQVNIKSLNNSLFNGSSLYIYPAFGWSNSNIGPDLDALGQNVPLCRISRFGFSTKVGLAIEYADETIDIISITAAYENENQNRDIDYDNRRKKYGIELGLFETGCVRFGEITQDWDGDVDTYGYSVKLHRLFRLIYRGHEDSNPFSNIQIEFHYSKQDHLIWYLNNDRELYKLTVTIY
ncbi:MAG: hypothetical protein ABIE07_11435 [Candidatus Zixiibacteriota bacterium]